MSSCDTSDAAARHLVIDCFSAEDAISNGSRAVVPRFLNGATLSERSRFVVLSYIFRHTP